MTEQEIKQTLKTKAEAEAPKIFDELVAECEARPKGNVIFMTETKKPNRLTQILGIAAAVALFFVAAFAAVTLINRNDNTVPTVIALDVNPSLELQLDENDKVLNVVPLNKDARTVIGDMDFTGSSLEVTVNALIGSMLRNGFLSEIANSILVSVNNENPERALALQQQLTEEINKILDNETFRGSVISQTVSETDELKETADRYGISVGKVKLINEMIRQNPLHTFDDLAPLSINELKLISESEKLALENTQTSGTASEKAFIGAEAAIAAAKAHAQVEEVSDLECELDSEKGIVVYDVEFRTQNTKYEYDINAKDGTVVKFETKTNNGNHNSNQSSTQNDTQNNTQNEPSEQTGTATPPRQETQTPSASTMISAAEAKEKAFAHAGINATEAWDLECELDHDDGKVKYEIEFKANGYEYEYDIEAYTGEVLKHEKERDD